MVTVGILQDIYNFGTAIIQSIRDSVKNVFTWAASGLQNAFNAIAGAVKTAVNWAWRGFDTVWKGIKDGISGLGTVLRGIYEWFLNGLKQIYNSLQNLMKYLFEVTEDLIMKYARWQVKVQMQLEKEIANSCG